jgi:hypothetical protein
MVLHLFRKERALILFSSLEYKRPIQGQNVLLEVTNQSSMALMVTKGIVNRAVALIKRSPEQLWHGETYRRLKSSSQ